MTWWTGNGEGQVVEPKRKFRFIVEIASGFFLPNVKTCSKPSANVDIKEFQLINHKFKYPGVVTWGDIKITMVDMNGGVSATGQSVVGEGARSVFKRQSLDTALLLWRMLKHTGYNFPTEATGPIAAMGPQRKLSATEKASTAANSFGPGIYGPADTSPAGVGNVTNAQAVKIYSLDSEGNTVETWTLHNPQIKSVNWGELSYEDDGLVEYSLDISYDWAHHERGKKIKVGSSVYKYPEENTPVSIGQKYQDFINVLQEGTKFGEMQDEAAKLERLVGTDEDFAAEFLESEQEEVSEVLQTAEPQTQNNVQIQQMVQPMTRKEARGARRQTRKDNFEKQFGKQAIKDYWDTNRNALRPLKSYE